MDVTDYSNYTVEELEAKENELLDRLASCPEEEWDEIDGEIELIRSEIEDREAKEDEED